jgi:hypothetical protein
MMNKKILHTKSHKRVALSFWQSLGHYSFMLVPLMFPAFELFYKLRGKTAVNTFSTRTQIIFILVSIIIGIFKWRELNYYEIKEQRTDNEFENAVLAAANKLNWRIDYFKENKVAATGYNPWKSRDSQTIKIERKRNKVLINSMMELGIITVPDFFGVNRQNRNTFLNYYYESDKIEKLNEKVIQQLKEEEDRIENEHEWSLKNTLKRIIAYIFSLGFWVIGIAIWNHHKSVGPLIIFGILGSSYIIFDIYVMWAKRKKAS